MTTQSIEAIISVKEQRFVLPGRQSWQQFKAIQSLMAEVPGVRVSYFDGCVELMTIGEAHEIIKTIIGLLLGLYFLEKRIEFIPVGSATRESEVKGTSFEPDQSYYIGERKEHPDLAIEVAFTSGDTKKLERYKRFKITEVWFWENNKISLYRFRGEDYEPISRSEFLPELDLDMLVRCVLMPSQLEAMTEFLSCIRQQKDKQRTTLEVLVVKIPAIIRGLNNIYKTGLAQGLECLEINIEKGDSEGLPYQIGQRVTVTLLIGSSSYIAGVRATSNNPYIWICPDLINEDGADVKLAYILKSEGFQKNQRITLEVIGDKIRVIT